MVAVFVMLVVIGAMAVIVMTVAVMRMMSRGRSMLT